jgi:hypothetical protein
MNLSVSTYIEKRVGVLADLRLVEADMCKAISLFSHKLTDLGEGYDDRYTFWKVDDCKTGLDIFKKFKQTIDGYSFNGPFIYISDEDLQTPLLKLMTINFIMAEGDSENSEKVAEILNKYTYNRGFPLKQTLWACQYELIDNGFEEVAKW